MRSKTAQRILDETPPETSQNVFHYSLGFKSANKSHKKIILDLLNKYKSWLTEEKHVKLSKTPNYIKQVTLESKIELLNEILSKL